MQKCDFNLIEITLLRGYSPVSILHICNKTPTFGEDIWGTASLYFSKYTDYNIEVVSKQVKNSLKYISAL